MPSEHCADAPAQSTSALVWDFFSGVGFGTIEVVVGVLVLVFAVAVGTELGFRLSRSGAGLLGLVAQPIANSSSSASGAINRMIILWCKREIRCNVLQIISANND